MLDFEGKKVVVVGMKKTGVALCRFLQKRNALITLTDIADAKDLSPYISEVRNLNVKLELGGHKDETFENADMIILSPGVPHTIGPIRKAMTKNIPVTGEIEVASRFINEPIAAVTGTNGKTTTTELLGKMLNNSGIKTFVGGNIGNPLIGYADQPGKADVVVVEVSSFQLDTIDTFKPKVGILLNITDDHLDRYDNLEAYAASKERIFQNQGPEDFAILNQSDPFTAGISNRIKSKKWLFDIKNEDREGVKIFPDKILFCINKTRKESIDIKDITLFGKHNLENISAAGLAALAVGGTIKGIRHAVKEFKGLSHRLEYVDEICGVKFFDDSKGTNVDAVRKAVLSFGNPIVLIMGGRDKGGLFHTLKDCVKNSVKKLIVMGEAKDIIASALNGSSPIAFAEDMEDAVLSAYKAASTGDIVLLSPGCASFDMYENYAKRGESFCNAVKNIRLKNR